MGSIHRRNDGAATLKEMQGFAGFPAATQRYVRRSLDIGLHRADAIQLWSRDMVEAAAIRAQAAVYDRSEEHTSELQSLMRTSYAVFCLKKKKNNTNNQNHAPK